MTKEGAAGRGLNGKAAQKARPGSEVDLSSGRLFLRIHTYGAGAGGGGESKVLLNYKDRTALVSPKKPEQLEVEKGGNKSYHHEARPNVQRHVGGR